jgi:hypothetical protein
MPGVILLDIDSVGIPKGFSKSNIINKYVYMDSNISSSLAAKPDEQNVTQLTALTIEEKKAKRMRGLVPFKKGDGRIRGKKPKGAASLPNAIDRIIDRRGVDAIAATLVDTAMGGSVPAHRTLLELGGALKDTPVTVAIQNNNSIISTEILAAALELLKNRQI